MKSNKIITITTCLLILSLAGNIFMGNYIYKKSSGAVKVAAVENIATNVDFEEYAKNYCVEKLSKWLDEKELQYIAQRQYQYYLMVNEKLVTGDTIYLSNVNTVKIVLSEVVTEDRSLPEELQKTGSLEYGDAEAKLSNYISVYSIQDYEVIKTVEGVNTKYTIEIKDVTKNSVISIVLNQILLDNLSQENNIQGNNIDICIQ